MAMAVKKRVVLGGTFDVLHDGHKKLLSVAFQISPDVTIGLTSDMFAYRTKGREVYLFPTRKKALTEYIRSTGHTAKIVKIEDEFGPAVAGDYDVLVASSETYPTAQKLNKAREAGGKPALDLVVVPLVLDTDGTKFSASLLRDLEPELNRKKPVARR